MGFESFSSIIIPFTSVKYIFLAAAGTFLGVYIGAIPGLSVTMAFSLLVSLTFPWETMAAIAFMIGVWCGGVYGGSRSAILLNIPGAPAAVATVFDGYPLAKLGLAGEAMGISTIQSIIGGFIGLIALMVAAPLLSQVTIKFAPRDYFLVSIMGILLVSSLSRGSTLKGLFAGALGVLIGLIGLDPFTAKPVLTFGIPALGGGIHYVVAMMALFGISESLIQLKYMEKPIKQKVDKIIPELKHIKRYFSLTLKSSLIGVFIGALPGTGGDIAALISYDQAKRSIKNPSRPFGEGAIEGIIAPESANNAAIGGALIPMLTMGIPGDSATAVMIGALMIHGYIPGPMLMREEPEIFGIIVGLLILSNLFLIIFGLTGIKIFAKVVEIPKAILVPIIVILTVAGSYTIYNNPTHILWVFGIGIAGYFFKLYGFSTASMVLGVILARLIDDNLRRALQATRGNVPKFIISIFTNPISLILFSIIVIMLLMGSEWWNKWWDKNINAKKQ